jgi:hypothetical protein
MLRTKILIALTTALAVLPLFPAGAAQAAGPYLADTTQQKLTKGITATGNPSKCDINCEIGRVVNILSSAVGVAAVIMVLVGGFRYITSGGSSEKVTSAKNTILYALIGVAVAALAQVLVRFVLSKTL